MSMKQGTYRAGDRVRIARPDSVYTGCRGTVAKHPGGDPDSTPLGYHVAIDGENGLTRPFLTHELARLTAVKVRRSETREQGAHRENDEGAGYASSVIEAIEFAIAHREEYAIRVLNLSLGHPVHESYRTDPLARAVERAWAAGLVVVASAGNRGRDGSMTINSP